MNAEVVRLWARLLREMPDSRLVLQAYAFADEGVSRRYRKMFAREGIAGTRLDSWKWPPRTANCWPVMRRSTSRSIRFLTPAA